MASGDVSFLCSLQRWGEDFIGMEKIWQVISVNLCQVNFKCLPCPALCTNKAPVSRAVNQEPLRVGKCVLENLCCWATLWLPSLLICFIVHNELPVSSCKAVPDLQFFIRQISLGLVAWCSCMAVHCLKTKCRFHPDESSAFFSLSDQVGSSNKVTASQSRGMEMTYWNDFWLLGKYLLSMNDLCPR